MKNLILKAGIKINDFVGKSKAIIRNNSGQGMIDVASVVLISVVLAALVLAGLYKLLGDTVLPSLTEKIQDMFNYSD